MLCVEGARTRSRDVIYVGERTMGHEKFPVILCERKLYCVRVQCSILK